MTKNKFLLVNKNLVKLSTSEFYFFPLENNNNNNKKIHNLLNTRVFLPDV